MKVSIEITQLPQEYKTLENIPLLEKHFLFLFSKKKKMIIIKSDSKYKFRRPGSPVVNESSAGMIECGGVVREDWRGSAPLRLDDAREYSRRGEWVTGAAESKLPVEEIISVQTRSSTREVTLKGIF